jgi:hypothetical protein
MDATFDANWRGAQAVGLFRGSYQFFRPLEDGTQQADVLLAKIGGALAPRDLPPTLDVEVTDGASSAEIAAGIAAWTQRIRAALGREPMIYCSPGFWNGNGLPSENGLDDLWVAHWFVNAPQIPSGWTSWTFWQYADNGSVPGIAGRVDRDRFDGDGGALAGFAGGTAAATPPPADTYVGVAGDLSGKGYWLVAGDGGVFTFGDGQFEGSMGGKALAAEVSGIARTASGGGYWLCAEDGGVFAFGDAAFEGSMAGHALSKPVVGIAGTPSGKGYWLVGGDGGVFAFGDAGFYGSMGGHALNAPVVAIAPTPSGKGYWLAAGDGGVFGFGDAGFHGSMGASPLNAPVSGIAATPSGKGYWLCAGDGGVFGFGDAGFHSGMAGRALNGPVTSIAATPTGKGYWLVGRDGGVFAFGDAVFAGSQVH